MTRQPRAFALTCGVAFLLAACGSAGGSSTSATAPHVSPALFTGTPTPSESPGTAPAPVCLAQQLKATWAGANSIGMNAQSSLIRVQNTSHERCTLGANRPRDFTGGPAHRNWPMAMVSSSDYPMYGLTPLDTLGAGQAAGFILVSAADPSPCQGGPTAIFREFQFTLGPGVRLTVHLPARDGLTAYCGGAGVSEIGTTK